MEGKLTNLQGDIKSLPVQLQPKCVLKDIQHWSQVDLSREGIPKLESSATRLSP